MFDCLSSQPSVCVALGTITALGDGRFHCGVCVAQDAIVGFAGRVRRRSRNMATREQHPKRQHKSNRAPTPAAMNMKSDCGNHGVEEQGRASRHRVWKLARSLQKATRRDSSTLDRLTGGAAGGGGGGSGCGMSGGGGLGGAEGGS